MEEMKENMELEGKKIEDVEAANIAGGDSSESLQIGKYIRPQYEDFGITFATMGNTYIPMYNGWRITISEADQIVSEGMKRGRTLTTKEVQALGIKVW